jgi:putative ABC transport system permease protein
MVATRLRYRLWRTLLAAAGVGVGAGSMVFLANITGGLAGAAEMRLASLGASLVMIVPQRIGATPPMSLSLADVASLKRQVPGVLDVVPLLQFRASVQACGQTVTVAVLSAGPLLHQMGQHHPALGRLLTSVDDERGRSVAVISRGLRARLPCVAPQGGLLQLQGHPLRTVGVLASLGTLQQSGDEAVLVPRRVLEERFGNRFDGTFSLWVLLRSGFQPDYVSERMSALLKRRHRIDSETPAGFVIRTRSDIAADLRTFEDQLRHVLTAVMCWSFIISGIGIANAVLSSVLERTPSIGLQRAVGAKRRHIRLEYLMESTVTSVAGAVLGIAVGSAGAALCAVWLKLPIRIDPHALVVAVLSSVSLGVAAGWWPAMRAARTDPCEAMRAE